MTDLTTWIGRSEVAEDTLDPGKLRLMEATLDRPPALAEGDALPPLWHWLFFNSPVATQGLGPDGHAARGGFLPPVALPRRMWAGGRLKFDAPLRIGAPARRISTIEAVAEKTGRAGPLVFVTVRHEIEAGGHLTEWHDIVYRGPADGAPKREPAPNGTPVTRITPSLPLLFRYSALTFNTHRIHYDADYCRDVEGYPGPIVHGPLIATYLAGLAMSQLARPLERFNFRAKQPLFVD
ncbi:MAG: MaoC family dehydratase N-terminal domain-containing protein, partial [Pseudomonadota bacterium]